MKLDSFLILCAKINSKWIIDLNVRTKAIKLLEENIDVNLCYFGLDKGFLDMTSKAQARKEKLDKLNIIKIF